MTSSLTQEKWISWIWGVCEWKFFPSVLLNNYSSCLNIVSFVDVLCQKYQKMKTLKDCHHEKTFKTTQWKISLSFEWSEKNRKKEKICSVLQKRSLRKKERTLMNICNWITKNYMTPFKAHQKRFEQKLLY